MTLPPAPDPVDDARGADSDAALMGRVQTGDAAAFEGLVRRHAGRVRALALRQTGSAADADEIAQEVFAQLWHKASQFDPARGAFRSWLYRIVASRCLDLMRWRLRRGVPVSGAPVNGAAAELADDAISPALFDPGPGAERAVIGRDALAAAAAAIRDLPRRQRLALLMAAVSELEAAEIGAALGTSRAGAEQLIARARRQLRTRAASEGWALSASDAAGSRR
ncbi:MAG: sigma-70 family RNA polymerase sigma factor [Pseudomonadota bacterium]